MRHAKRSAYQKQQRFLAVVFVIVGMGLVVGILLLINWASLRVQ